MRIRLLALLQPHQRRMHSRRIGLFILDLELDHTADTGRHLRCRLRRRGRREGLGLDGGGLRDDVLLAACYAFDGAFPDVLGVVVGGFVLR